MIHYHGYPPICYSKCSASYSQCSRTSTPCSYPGTPCCSRPGSRPTTPCLNRISSRFPLYDPSSSGYFQCSCASPSFKPERLICSAFSLYPSVTQLCQKRSKKKRRRTKTNGSKNKNNKNGSKSSSPNRNSRKPNRIVGAKRESKNENKTEDARRELITEKDKVTKKKVIDKPNLTMGKIEEEKIKEETEGNVNTMIAGKTNVIEQREKFVNTDNSVINESKVNNSEKGVTVNISNDKKKDSVKEYKSEETNTGRGDGSNVSEKGTVYTPKIPSFSLCTCKNQNYKSTPSVQDFRSPSQKYPPRRNLCQNCLLKKTAFTQVQPNATSKFHACKVRSNSYLFNKPAGIPGIQNSSCRHFCAVCRKNKHLQLPDHNRQNKCGTCGCKKVNPFAYPNAYKPQDTKRYEDSPNLRNKMHCCPNLEGTSEMGYCKKPQLEFSHQFDRQISFIGICSPRIYQPNNNQCK